jgi:2-iminoacetate synthase
MYDPKSEKAADFINHEEITATLEYAQKEKNNRALIDSLLEKAKACKGLTHREAAVLLASDDKEVLESIFSAARHIKEAIYGQRIVLFAPLYLSNHCINACTYCPYHAKNKNIIRKKLTQEEITREVMALQDMGHKRLLLEAGEHPTKNPIEYILESIRTIYSIKHRNGEIRRLNVNIAATTVENYRKLHEAQIGTYQLFQETYHRDTYKALHPKGPKSDYDYHTEAHDRAMLGGIDDVGLGVLFGLNLYAYDLVGLIMHAEHLEARFGVGPHTISVPRICPADDINPENFENAVPDDIFLKIVAIIRLAVPYTGMIMSTRESERTRNRALELGISQISGGSRTSVGGYTVKDIHEVENTAQFDTSDRRTLDEVVRWLLQNNYLPSFCTACYRAGRTGDRFMEFAKTGEIAMYCQANAVMTMKEYLCDYATPKTRAVGEEVIQREIPKISHEKVRLSSIKRLERIEKGERDFRY